MLSIAYDVLAARSRDAFEDRLREACDLFDAEPARALRLAKRHINCPASAECFIRLRGLDKVLSAAKNLVEEHRKRSPQDSTQRRDEKIATGEIGSSAQSCVVDVDLLELCLSVLANCCFIIPAASLQIKAYGNFLAQTSALLASTHTTGQELVATILRFICNVAINKECAAVLLESGEPCDAICDRLMSEATALKAKEHCLRFFRNVLSHGKVFGKRLLKKDAAFAIGKALGPGTREAIELSPVVSEPTREQIDLPESFKLKALELFANFAKLDEECFGVQMTHSECISHIMELAALEAGEEDEDVKRGIAEKAEGLQLQKQASDLVLALSRFASLRPALTRYGATELLRRTLASNSQAAKASRNAHLFALTKYCNDACGRQHFRDTGLLALLVDEFSAAEPCSEVAAVLAQTFFQFIYDPLSMALLENNDQFISLLFRQIDHYRENHVCNHVRVFNNDDYRPVMVTAASRSAEDTRLADTLQNVLGTATTALQQHEYRPDSPSYLECLNAGGNTSSDWDDEQMPLHKNYLNPEESSFSARGKRELGPNWSPSASSVGSFLSSGGSSPNAFGLGSPNASPPWNVDSMSSGSSSPSYLNTGAFAAFEAGGYSPDSSDDPFRARRILSELERRTASCGLNSFSEKSRPAGVKRHRSEAAGGVEDSARAKRSKVSIGAMEIDKSVETKIDSCRGALEFHPCECLNQTWGDFTPTSAASLAGSPESNCLESVLSFLTWLSHNTNTSQLLLRKDRLETLLNYMAKACNPNPRACRIVKRLIRETVFAQTFLSMEFHFMVSDLFCGGNAGAKSLSSSAKDGSLQLPRCSQFPAHPNCPEYRSDMSFNCPRCAVNCKIGCSIYEEFAQKIDSEHPCGILAHWLASRNPNDKWIAALATGSLIKQKQWRYKLMLDWRALDQLLEAIIREPEEEDCQHNSETPRQSIKRAIDAMLACFDSAKLTTAVASRSKPAGSAAAAAKLELSLSDCEVDKARSNSAMAAANNSNVCFVLSKENASHDVLNALRAEASAGSAKAAQGTIDLEIPKSLLVERSSFYQVMLEGSFREADQNRFQVEESLNAFVYFIHFLCGCRPGCPTLTRISIDSCDFIQLINLADQHVIPELTEHLLESFSRELIDSRSFAEFARAGIVHKLAQLWSLAFSFVILQLIRQRTSGHVTDENTDEISYETFASFLRELHDEQRLVVFVDWFKQWLKQK